MRQFNAVYGSSLSDVCLNTYGSLDFYVKLLNDNGVEPNQLPYSGQPFMWDETLVFNQTTQSLINANGIIYATLLGYGVPEQVNPVITMYKDAIGTNYTATTDGETVITISALQGNEIVQIEKEIKPLVAAQYIFDPIAGTITLLEGLSLVTDETLFVIYKKTITS